MDMLGPIVFLVLVFKTTADSLPLISNMHPVEFSSHQGQRYLETPYDSNVSLICFVNSADEPKWTTVNQDVPMSQRTDCSAVACSSRMDIPFVQPPDTGFFSCCSKMNNCSSVYLFVNDEEQLIVEEMIFMKVTQSKPVTIPCKSTFVDAEVDLKSAINGKSITETNFNVSFSPYDGFVVKSPFWNTDWAEMTCEVKMGPLKSEGAMKLTWDYAPSFSLQPIITSSPQHVVNGNSMTVNCTVEVETGVSVQFKWSVPEQSKFPESTSVLKTESEMRKKFRSSIYFNHTTNKNTGNYKCQVTASGSESYFSAETFITIHDNSHVEIFESNVNLSYGSEMSLIVPLNESKITKLQWTKDGELISSNNSNIQIEDHFTSFQIPQAASSDSGKYVLKLQVDGHERWFVFHVAIEGDSTFTLTISISLLLAALLISLACIENIRRLKKKNNFDVTACSSKVELTKISTEAGLPSKLILSSHDLTLDTNELGAGAFGSVYKAMLKTSGDEAVVVAVKQCKLGASESEMRALRDELNVMKSLKPHPHIVNLIGVIIESQLQLVVEYCPLGNLKDFLYKNRRDFGVVGSVTINQNLGQIVATSPIYLPIEVDISCLNTDALINYCIQVAKGMAYLSSKKVLHRDLAARNVLLVNHHLVKICDFGLSKNCYDYQEFIYTKKVNSPMPFKWLAIESILDRVFTTKSDVWAFGILMWEIFSLGADPYPGQVVDRTFVDMLLKGQRLEPPSSTPKSICDAMKTCWVHEPENRPDFNQLSILLMNAK